MFGDGLGTADLFGCVTCLVVEYVIETIIILHTMGVNETVPHGVSPEYYFESRVPVINALSVCYITISTIALLLRYLSKRISGLGLWWDD